MSPSRTISILDLWRQTEALPEWTEKDWEIVLGQAGFAGVAGKLAQHYSDRNCLKHVPSRPRNYLEGWIRLVDRQRHEIRFEVDAIAQACRETGSQVVLLKGAAYLMANLPNSRGRLFSDIDIMVPRARLDEVEGALFKNGWISEERDPYNDRYYREWMHEIPPMRHVQRNSVIDLHHTITAPTSAFRVDSAKLFERIVPIDADENLFVLCPSDMVLHSAAHLFQEGEFNHGLRDLLDLRDLLNHFEAADDFYAELFTRARELGLTVPLYHALVHIERLFGSGTIDCPEREISAIRPNIVSEKAMYWLLGRVLKSPHPSCAQDFDGLARFLMYVRSHYLRMPLYLVVPHLLRKAWIHTFPPPRSQPQDRKQII